MADRSFEMELDRMFADAPTFADGDLFAMRIEERLERGWTFRQLLIGGLGLAGGLIGGAQVLGSGILERIGALGYQSNHLMSGRLAGLAVSSLLPADLAVNGEVLWMSAALGILAVGFVVVRTVREP